MTIISTIGPSCRDKNTLVALRDAGVDILE